MCVVLVAEDKRPSAEMVEKAYEANSQGCGYAYRGDDGLVHWRKGLAIKVEEMKELAGSLPTPYVMHFRIASVGGVRPGLCHPFPIAKNAPLDLTGKTKGFVLFHNGHWTGWEKECKEIAAASKLRGGGTPTGRWSDSRAMAWYAAHYDIGALDWLNEKIVAFGTDQIEIFGSGWSFEEGVLVSNRYFLTGGRTTFTGFSNRTTYGHEYVTTMCHNRKCLRKDLDKDGWCPLHAHENPNKKPETKLLEGPKEEKKEQTGGSAQALPFETARRLWMADKLSNKKFKAACRAASVDYEGMKNLRKRLQDQKVGREVPPVMMH